MVITLRTPPNAGYHFSSYRCRCTWKRYLLFIFYLELIANSLSSNNNAKNCTIWKIENYHFYCWTEMFNELYLLHFLTLSYRLYRTKFSPLSLFLLFEKLIVIYSIYILIFFTLLVSRGLLFSVIVTHNVRIVVTRHESPYWNFAAAFSSPIGK